ncbi:MAG: hypothetical protein BRD25_05680 [Bacteroidetes bacterium QH_1_61_8]|nr:MAG: hypothetical protein BRD25_05680 [Bacteroidetes bacterium QH_1_61_8]
MPDTVRRARRVRLLGALSRRTSHDCFVPLTTDTPMAATRWISTTLAGLLLVLAGCGGLGEDFALSAGGVDQAQFEKAIKQSLENLYRTNPAIVDSLFEEHAASQLEDADLSGAVVKDGQIKPKLLNEYKNKAFKTIKDHYRQPQLQEGVSGITYPDSLRTQENSGRVELQMHVDSTGTVNAVEVIEGTHPTLNAIAMKAATGTTWEPGYVRQGAGEEWQPRPGWGRSPINFPAPR